MGFFHSHGAAKFGFVSLVIGILHFFEDMALLLSGRYTNINIGIIIIGGLIFSLCLAGIFKLKFMKKHLL